MLTLKQILTQIEKLAVEELTFAYTQPSEGPNKPIPDNISDILAAIKRYYQILITRNYDNTESATNALIEEIIKLTEISITEKLSFFSKLSVIQDIINDPDNASLNAFQDALISIKFRTKVEKQSEFTLLSYKRNLLSQMQTVAESKITSLQTECSNYRTKNNTKNTTLTNLKTILATEGDTSLTKLKKFRTEYPKTNFEKSSDHPFVHFLKRIADILSFKQFTNRIWKINGKEFSIKVVSIFASSEKRAPENAEPKKEVASRLS